MVCDTGARTVLSGFPAGWEPPGWVTANSTSAVSRATSAASSASVRLTGSVLPTTADTPPQVDHTPKCSWIWRTAIDPSPTADATLFTEPLRHPSTGRAGRDEAVVVELDGAGEPRRVGHGTDEDEQRPRVDRLARG